MNPADFPRQLARTGRLSFGLPRALTVSPDGRRVLFLRTQAGDDPSGLLWLYRDGAERVLADPARLPAAPGGPPPEELARRERTRERSAGVVAGAAAVVASAAVVGGVVGVVPVPLEQPSSSVATATEPKRARTIRFMGVDLPYREWAGLLTSQRRNGAYSVWSRWCASSEFGSP